MASLTTSPSAHLPINRTRKKLCRHVRSAVDRFCCCAAFGVVFVVDTPFARDAMTARRTPNHGKRQA